MVGENPNKAAVLVKTNDYCVYDENKLSNVTIQGVDFFGSSVGLFNSENQNILFHDVYFQYIGGALLFN